MRQLDSGARESKPQAAAKAQADFDCWVEQQEENHQPDDIAACRDDFYTSMGELEEPPAVPATAPEPQAPSTFTVLFEWNSDVLTPAGQAVIREALADTSGRDVSSVSTIGHADRSGSEEYNLTLSLRRADAVRQSLIAGGIPAGSITAAGRGEAEPAMPTADGVREQANRRVEIFLP
jgi:OOP family OmpA-OmpF porin